MLRYSACRSIWLAESARLKGDLVFKLVEAPDVIEIVVRGAETRYKLTRPASHAVHAAIASKSPVRVSAFVRPDARDPDTCLRSTDSATR